MGCNPPPPAPCITRKRRRKPRLGANPHSSELTVKMARQLMKNRLRPTAPASHPVIGRTMAFETRYEVNTQVLSSLLAPRFPAMYGRATLAMLGSRTSMNAAMATTTAITQGLYFGFHGSVAGAASVGVSASAIGALLHVDLRIDRHAGAQS